MFTGDLGASGHYSVYAGSEASSSSLSFSPGIDYFVGSHVSIGIGLVQASASSETIDPTNGVTITFATSRTSVAPRLGYDLRLARWLSWYARTSLALDRQEQSETALTKEIKQSAFVINASLYAPLLIHAVPHFFVGLGPQVSQDLVRSVEGTSNRATTLGAAFTVGGWL